jgi:exopolyphosphatase/guanosine-5'-triphosphate,3'-diphosphate pyrophosphatase
VAAVDLGSNSFHLALARALEHDIQMLDRIREPVRLAEGMTDDRLITDAAADRALACLERFAQRIHHLDARFVRAVGTNTLRTAKNGRAFLRRAQGALGFRIEVVSGSEEARLIYNGVAHGQPGDASRLVVDIGGGSTEVILGEGFEVQRVFSLYMGCVGYGRFFPGGDLGRDRFRNAQTAAARELQAIVSTLTDAGWEEVVGASGTINAVSTILRANGWTDGTITTSGMKKLRKALVAGGNLSQISIPGLKADRLEVLPGGLAILMAIHKSLALTAMTRSGGALREGVLYDLVGRIHHEDARDRTIRRMVEQYRVDERQAERVEQTARTLLTAAYRGRAAATEENGEGLARKLIRWAARLHEIGRVVSFTGYHKHSAYLVQHADMPGFSEDDQVLLASILRGQRRKLAWTYFDDVAETRREFAKEIAVLFRIAVLLCRARAGATRMADPGVELDLAAGRLTLHVAAGWRMEQPLTAADLDEEGGYLAAAGVTLSVVETSGPRSRTSGATP